MLEHFIEERMDPATKKRLRDALKSMDKAELESVLEHCDRQGYITSIVRQCRELFEKIVDAEAALDFAMNDKTSKKVEYLEKALEMCEAFDYNAGNVQKVCLLD